MEPFHIGVTGTRRDTTAFQQKRLLELLVFLRNAGATTLHHGDCVGADALAHDLAIRAGLEHIVIHPPMENRFRAFCTLKDGLPCKGISPEQPKPYLTRNHDIVAAVHAIIALPKSEEILRSGTWTTVRFARENTMPIYLLYPWRVETENDPFDWTPTERFPNPWAR